MRIILLTSSLLIASSGFCWAQSPETSKITMTEFLELDPITLIDGRYNTPLESDIFRTLYSNLISSESSWGKYSNEFEKERSISTHRARLSEMKGRAFGNEFVPKIKERAFFVVTDRDYNFKTKKFELCPYFEQNNFKQWSDRYGSSGTIQLKKKISIHGLDSTKAFSYWQSGVCLYKDVPLKNAENYVSAAVENQHGVKGYYGYAHLNAKRFKRWSHSRFDITLESEKFEIEDKTDGTISVVTNAK